LLANYRVGMCHQSVGDYRRAAGLLRQTVEALSGDLARERLGMFAPASVFAQNRLIPCLAELGEFAEAVGISQQLIRLAETLDHPPSLILAYRGSGLLRLYIGEPQQAIPVLEHGLLLCRTVELPLMFPAMAAELGHAFALVGRVAEALPLLERAVERGDVMGYMLAQSQRVTWLGEAYLRAGRID